MRIPTLAALAAAILLSSAASAAPVSLQCEFGQQVALGGDTDNDYMIDLYWQGKQFRMRRVGTSTGAQRFENNEIGLVWISIPSKGMLLDSVRGKPLVNECKTASAAQFTQ